MIWYLCSIKVPFDISCQEVTYFREVSYRLHIVITLLLTSLNLICRESDSALDEDGSANKNGKRQLKLSSLGFTGYKRNSEEIESTGKGRCKFFQARKLEQLTQF